jgi:hypothetical protein
MVEGEVAPRFHRRPRSEGRWVLPLLGDNRQPLQADSCSEVGEGIA